MRDDLECPYCEAELQVCHDDGQGYDEDTKHEMKCRSCEKSFTFTTYVSYHYTPAKADCLNGASHKIKTWDREWSSYSKDSCEDCNYISHNHKDVEATAPC